MTICKGLCANINIYTYIAIKSKQKRYNMKSDVLIVDLKGFRRRNKLSQDQVAAILGISRGFISQIESGKCKLSDEKIEALVKSAKENLWDSDALFPAYERILKLDRYLKDNYLFYNLCVETTDEVGLLLESSFIPVMTLVEISRGKTGISHSLADSICREWPKVSFNWLVSGEGDLEREGLTSEQIAAQDRKYISKQIELIEKRLDYIESLLKEIRAAQVKNK